MATVKKIEDQCEKQVQGGDAQAPRQLSNRDSAILYNALKNPRQLSDRMRQKAERFKQRNP